MADSVENGAYESVRDGMAENVPVPWGEFAKLCGVKVPEPRKDGTINGALWTQYVFYRNGAKTAVNAAAASRKQPWRIEKHKQGESVIKLTDKKMITAKRNHHAKRVGNDMKKAQTDLYVMSQADGLESKDKRLLQNVAISFRAMRHQVASTIETIESIPKKARKEMKELFDFDEDEE